MSDDFSITDNIVLQNAAIDASLRKMSMRHRPSETYREQKQSRVVFYTVMEKAPIPLVLNGNVIESAFLKHKYPQRDCSLSRGVEVFRFDDEAEVKAFYTYYYQEYPNSDIYRCPECYPEYYKSLSCSDESKSRRLQAIKNGLRLAAILPTKPGYYFFQDKKVYPLCFDNGKILNVRFFHPAGCQCRIMNDRSLYGPYKDVSSALNSLDIGTEKNGVRNLPCPYCYADSVYKHHKYIKVLHKPVIDALMRYTNC